MVRNWLRIYRLYGIRPFGLLVVVVLVFALILDKQVTRYDQVSTLRQSLKAELGKKRGKVDQQAANDKRLENAKATYTAISPRLAAGDAPESVNLVAPLSAWLSGLGGLREVAGTVVAPTTNADGTYVGAQMTFKTLPQGVVKMLRQLSSSPTLLRVPELELSVSNIDAPAELQGRIRLETVYLQPAPEILPIETGKGRGKSTSAASAATAPSNGKTAVTTPGARPPAAEKTEAGKDAEKRKTPTAGTTSIAPRAAPKP